MLVLVLVLLPPRRRRTYHDRTASASSGHARCRSRLESALAYVPYVLVLYQSTCGTSLPRPMSTASSTVPEPRP